MRRIRQILMVCLGAFAMQTDAQTTIRMYDYEMFYGGYASLETQAADTIVTTPAGAGVKRLKTSLLAKKFTDEQLNQIGDRLHLKVLLHAACDNYDRGGHVYIALVQKGILRTAIPNVLRLPVSSLRL